MLYDRLTLDIWRNKGSGLVEELVQFYVELCIQALLGPVAWHKRNGALCSESRLSVQLLSEICDPYFMLLCTSTRLVFLPFQSVFRPLSSRPTHWQGLLRVRLTRVARF